MLSALFAGIAAIITKKALVREHAMEFAATLAIMNAIITAPFLFFIDYASIPPSAYALIVTISLITAVAYLLVVKAVRHLPISVSSPFLILGPAITAILAYFFLEETLAPMSIAGIFLIIIGIVVLQHKKGVSFKKSLGLMLKAKHMRFIYLALLLYGFAAMIDRYLLGPPSTGGLGIPVTSALPLAHLFIAIIFVFLISFFHGGLKDIRHGINSAGFIIVVVAVLTVSYRLVQGIAVGMEDGMVALVEALKRTSALIAIIIGGELFHEEHILQRGFAALIIIAGAVLIIL